MICQSEYHHRIVDHVKEDNKETYKKFLKYTFLFSGNQDDIPE